MAVMDGADYDSYEVYVNLPRDRKDPETTIRIDEVINAGLVALGYEPVSDMETSWIDSHYN